MKGMRRDSHPNPSPGGKVARPSASEEIAGRMRNAGENLRVSTIYQTYGLSDTEVFRKSQQFLTSEVIARIPHQSPIGSEEPIGDSFSPGEAFWWKTRPDPNHSNLKKEYPI